LDIFLFCFTTYCNQLLDLYQDIYLRRQEESKSPGTSFEYFRAATACGGAKRRGASRASGVRRRGEVTPSSLRLGREEGGWGVGESVAGAIGFVLAFVLGWIFQFSELNFNSASLMMSRLIKENDKLQIIGDLN
jgi:hypothetical protein